MRKLEARRPRSLPFRSLLVVAGALALMAALAPHANADLIAYFNFEGPTGPPFPVNLQSQVPPGAVLTTMTTNYTPADMLAVAGLPLNVAPGDPDPNLVAMGLRHTILNDPADFDIPLFSPQGFYQNMTVTFAYNINGNGFSNVQLFYSTNGGGTFTAGPSAVLLNGGVQLATLAVPVGANNAPLLVLRLQFTGGGTGENIQTRIDNIQINGVIVPEPATVVGGLLGILGLCWHQRLRLIRCVRLRPP